MKAYSLDLREKIVEIYATEDISQRKLAQRFHVSLSFIEKLLKQWRETGNLAPKPHGGGSPPKLNAEQRALVQVLVESKNDATLDELCREIQQQTDVVVSRATMGRVVQQLKLTRKKTLYATEADSPRVQQARCDYWAMVRDIPPEDLVFIDEAGANLAMVRLYARAPKGQRAIGDRPQRRGQNVSLVEALTLQGPIAAFQGVGSMDGLTFEAYLIQRVIPNLWPGACVILDNSPIHNSNEDIDAALAAVGARLMFLPPYSPDFSPIEPFWSKVKDVLKSIAPRTYQALKKAMDIAYEKVSLSDIRNWFAFRCYCTSPE